MVNFIFPTSAEFASDSSSAAARSLRHQQHPATMEVLSVCRNSRRQSKTQIYMLGLMF